MADACLIGRYLEQVGRQLTTRHSARVLTEIEDHLRERVADLLAAGSDPEDAERAAVEAFGTFDDVARAFNDVGRAVPTKFTRWSGLLGLVGFVVLVAAILWDGAQPAPPKGELEPAPWFLLAPLTLVLTGFAGLVVRTRGAFGRTRGGIAVLLIAIGIALAPAAYGLVAGVVVSAVLFAGLGIVFGVVYKEAVLPRPATTIFCLPILVMSMLAPTSLEKQSMPYYLGFALLAAGWVWLQYTLWSERPEHRSAWCPPADRSAACWQVAP